MTKTVTIDVPIEVRKTGPDLYRFKYHNGDWSTYVTEADARRLTAGSAFMVAIVQAIDSGAFVDPLPTAEGAHIYNPGSKVHFIRSDEDDDTPWISSRDLDARYWHTPEQVKSYGPFEVLYDPEAQS